MGVRKEVSNYSNDRAVAALIPDKRQENDGLNERVFLVSHHAYR